jgi:MarR family transcriptional regulator for hemolysin
MQLGQPPDFDPTSAPTFWINHASRLLLRLFEDRLRPLGFSMAYLRVALALEKHGPLQQKELLEHVAIEQPTMTALLARMERDRLLVRRPDPTDARARQVSLTGRGTAALTKVKEAMPEVAEEALLGVGQEDREGLVRTLQLVVKNLTERGERSDKPAPDARLHRSGSPKRRS